MTEQVKILIEQARALTPEERLEIAEALMDSVAAEDDAELTDDEIAERIAAIDHGKVQLQDADEVFAELRDRLGKQ